MTELKSKPAQGYKKADKKEAVPLSDVFYKTLRHWPWIILSVVICMAFATLYLLRTPKVYTRSAEIQVKDDNDGQSSLSMDAFKDLGVFQNTSNVKDEIAILQSRDLMEEVVRRLKLDVSYYNKGFFHDEVVYGTSLPVTVSFEDLSDKSSASFDLQVNKAGEVTIDKIKKDKEKFKGESYTTSLNDTIATVLGKLVVTPTSEYKKGETVDLKVVKVPFETACRSYTSTLGVDLADKDGNVINLTMSNQSPQRADDVLNTLIAVYKESWIRDKNQVTVSTSNFINERLGALEDELGNVDSDISSYKSQTMTPDVKAAASMYMQKSQKAEEEIIKINNALQMTRYVRQHLMASDNKYQLLPANTGIANQGIVSQISEYNKLVLKRNALAEKSSDQNPIVKQLDGSLASQRQAIINSVDNEIVDLSNQLKTYRASEAQTNSRIATNPTQAKNLLSVERQQKVKEELYLFLLQRREENELSQSFTAYNTKIVNRPGASDVPASPRSSMVLGLAFLIGLAIPFGVTYFKESNNTKLRGRNDVKNLAIPFLGEIPQDPESKGKKIHDNDRTIYVKPGTRDIVNESFRVLRTNVEFMAAADGACSLIAITSFNPGSGKSFITINLGMSIALKGKKVLVIDGDLRRGSASAYVGSPSKGLSNYLSGALSDINSVIVQSKECDHLDVLPVGPIPPNPTELLGLPKFAEMLESLKPHYDFILIDCPPIEVVADTQIVDRYVDRTFFVIRAGLLERAMIPELDRLYENKKYKNMAFILNGTSNEHSRYGYGYGYGYGYKYGNHSAKG